MARVRCGIVTRGHKWVVCGSVKEETDDLHLGYDWKVRVVVCVRVWLTIRMTEFGPIFEAWCISVSDSVKVMIRVMLCVG